MVSYLTSTDNILTFDPWRSYGVKIPIIPFERSYMTSYLTSMRTISLSRTVFEILDLENSGFDLNLWPLNVIWGWKNLYHSKAHIWFPIWLLRTTSLFLVKVIWGQKKYTIRKPIYNFLFDFYGQHLFIPYCFRDIRLLTFQGLTLTFDPWRSSGVKKNYTIRKFIYDFLFDFYGQPLSISYRFRDIRLLSFQGLTLTFDPWRSSGVKKIIPFKSSYMSSYLTSMDNISYPVLFSRYSTSNFSGFDLDLWPLKVIWGQNFSYHSKSHIWLPIRLLWTRSLHLVPIQRYSTSKFLGFDLDLRPLRVIWGQKNSYRLKAHIWLPIWLPWTTSLYLVPFQRYSTSKFLGFDLDLWPLKVIWGQKFLYLSKAHIWLPIWFLWTTSLYLVPFQRYSTSKFLGFDLDLWPLKVIWDQKTLEKINGAIPRGECIPFESPYKTSYLTSMDTISLSRTVLEIMPVKILKAEQNGGFWPF